MILFIVIVFFFLHVVDVFLLAIAVGIRVMILGILLSTLSERNTESRGKTVQTHPPPALPTTLFLYDGIGCFDHSVPPNNHFRRRYRGDSGYHPFFHVAIAGYVFSQPMPESPKRKQLPNLISLHRMCDGGTHQLQSIWATPWIHSQQKGHNPLQSGWSIV